MTLIANTNGEIRGKFAIPAKVPSGAKAVVFRGRGGSEATASFVGQGTLTVSNVIQARTITRYWTDPLAQTFALTAQAQVCGVDLWFTARGQSAVRVQIRDTDNGYPGKIPKGRQGQGNTTCFTHYAACIIPAIISPLGETTISEYISFFHKNIQRVIIINRMCSALSGPPR